MSTNSYAPGNDDDPMKTLNMGNPSSNRALDLDSPGGASSSSGAQGRQALQKQHPGVAEEGFMGRKRFSKRQSKSGLAAVF